MKFDKLNEILPYATGGKNYILTCSPYNGITLAFPGRHAKQTDPPGGDFLVMVDDTNMDWAKHPFTHNDIFNYIESKDNDLDKAVLMQQYFDVVVKGEAPPLVEYSGELLHPQTFLYSVQCLSVAEHRRYAQHEAKFGGRYLPLRFATGIAEGLWTAGEAAANQRRGRLGVEYLEHLKGVPVLTKELMND